MMFYVSFYLEMMGVDGDDYELGCRGMMGVNEFL